MQGSVSALAAYAALAGLQTLDTGNWMRCMLLRTFSVTGTPKITAEMEPAGMAASSALLSGGENAVLKIAGSRSEMPASGTLSTTLPASEQVWSVQEANEPVAGVVTPAAQAAVTRKPPPVGMFMKSGSAAPSEG